MTKERAVAREPVDGCAIVLGAAGGLGRAVVRKMAAIGTHLVLSYQNDLGKLQSLIAELNSAGSKFTCVQCDVTNSQSVRDAFHSAQETFGSIHSVVNTVGLPYDESPLAALDENQFRAVLDVDVIGFLNIAKAAVPIMRKQHAGSIVTVGTCAQDRFFPGNSLSTIPKSTVAAMVRQLAAEEGEHGIRVNMVGAGVYNAGMALRAATTDELMRQYADTIALRRLGDPEEFASVAAFLTTNAASYVTGQIIQSDGGLGL